MLLWGLFLYAGWNPLLAEDRAATLATSVDSTSVTVGDPVNLRVEVRRPESAKLVFPVVGAQLGDWTVKASRRTGPSKIEEGRSSETLEVQLTAYRTGEIEVPALSVEVVGSDGQREVLSTKPVKIKVESVLDAKDNQLKDLKGQAEVPTDYKPLLIALAGLGGVALAAYLVIRYFGRRRRPKPLVVPETRSPEERAREAIRKLLAKKLAENGYLKEFYLEISEIVKKYLGEKLDVLSLERTSAEFVRDLRRTTLSWDQVRLVREFLTDCDLVKFAKYRPADPEINQIVQRSFEIIDGTQVNQKPEGVAMEVLKP